MNYPGGPWGQVLQEPYLDTDLGGPDRKKALWVQRQAEMGPAQAKALADLTAALKAGRDKQMADLIAADAARAGSGGSGRGGGGGSSAAAVPFIDASAPPWVDAYLNQQQQTAPPTYDAGLAPSTRFGPNAVYSIPPKPLGAQPYSTTIASNRKGYRPAPQPAPYSTSITPGRKGYRPAPATRFSSRLS